MHRLIAFRTWLIQCRGQLATLLGGRYAATVDIVDRAATAFVLALVTGGVLDAADVFSTSAWHIAIRAAALAAASVVKSSLMTLITGSPALLSPVSSTLRARRDAVGTRPLHPVPVRPPGRRPMPYPRKAP